MEDTEFEQQSRSKSTKIVSHTEETGSDTALYDRLQYNPKTTLTIAAAIVDSFARPKPHFIDLTGDDEVTKAPGPLEPPPPPPPTVNAISSWKKVCNCGKPDSGSSGNVQCANEACAVGTYHKACVGLSNTEKYRDTTGWRCRNCRPKPPPMAIPQRPSTPPPIRSEYDVAAVAMPLNPPESPLHEEQAKIVAAVEEGYNVFYTGSAGTGKSTVLKAFVKGLKAQGKQVDIVAPSGIAALAIGGSTIYSYAGWHPDVFKNGLEKLVAKGWSRSIRKRLCHTDVLVIDEISMVESDMLTRLDNTMRAVRDGWKPERGEKRPQSRHSARYCMGGAQLIVTGDFCQLPPVKPFQFCLYCGGGDLPDQEPKACPRCLRVYPDKAKWAFSSPAWEAAEFSYFELKHIHRQKDAVFISILQKVRIGQSLSQQDKALLLKKKQNMATAVKLLPQKNEVNRKNLEGLRMLQGVPRSYDCVDCFDWRNSEEPALKDKAKLLFEHRPDGPLAALRDHRFEERIELKAGMLVILLINLDLTSGLVNGSQGKIVGFERWNPNIPLVQRPPGSPSRSGKGSKESDPVSEIAAFKENQCRQFVERAVHKEFPVVEFRCGITRPIFPSCQVHELGSEKPYSILSRTNVPLAAAWAITIHKSQGMTLDLVSVDLYNSFEKEMVYVALSRARSLEGLEVLRLPREDKHAMNPEVLQFLKDNVWTGG